MYKPYLMLFPLSVALLFAILAGCGTANQVSAPLNKGEGIALLKITATAGDPFQKLAKTATLTISASDMLTLTKSLTVTDSSVEGKITGIPAGKNRLFSVSVFDSLDTLQYQGSSTVNVIADTTVNVSINVVRITGNANINGHIIEGDTIPKNGLLAYYPFSGNANDSSGHVYNGTLTNVSLVPDRFGKPNSAYKSNGGRITVNNFPFDGSTGAMTLSEWIMPDSAWGSNSNFTEGVLVHNYGSFSFFIEQHDTGSGILYTWIFKTYQQNNPNAATVYSFTKNKWHHIAVVAKVNQEIIMYINNQKFATGKTCPDTIYTSTATLLIGGGMTGSYLNGCFDDVRIYNSALTDSQISALYHEGGWTGN